MDLAISPGKIISNIQANVAEAELLLFVNRAVQLIKICICEKFKIRRKDKQTNNKQNKKTPEFKAQSDGEGQSNHGERF